ncbi:hypothetical protein [Bordetella holmesii]|uniref:hypothetical protein n=1 Tax=Bordetella holmesii TaxID=35814 RepID=UPI001267A853|nr:hypothetical protein [Bordetella holmesii]
MNVRRRPSALNQASFMPAFSPPENHLQHIDLYGQAKTLTVFCESMLRHNGACSTKTVRTRPGTELQITSGYMDGSNQKLWR